MLVDEFVRSSTRTQKENLKTVRVESSAMCSSTNIKNNPMHADHAAEAQCFKP